jgi:hypothetical protein
MQQEMVMFVLKLRKVGKSIGCILPKEMLDHLHGKESHKIFAIETPSGYTLTSLDPQVQKQVEAGHAFLDRNGEIFAALAKPKSASD